MVQVLRVLGVAAVPILAGACLSDHPATITHAWSAAYPPALLAIRLGDLRIAGKDLETSPATPNTLTIFTQAPTGTAPLQISLVSGADTLAAVVTTVTLRAGQRFTLQIVAGVLSPGFTLSCARRIGPFPIRGGPSTDSLVVQWYETEPSNVIGPC